MEAGADAFYRCVKDGTLWMTNHRINGARCAVYAKFKSSSKPKPQESSDTHKDVAARTGSAAQSQGDTIDTAEPAKATREELEPIMQRAASEHGIPLALLRAVITVESGFNQEAVSPVGAQGLMQLMPATAAGLSVDDPFDPEQNIMAGARYLRMLSDRFNGDIEKTIAGYFSGPNKVARFGGIPSESCLKYVQTVQRLYTKFTATEAQ